MNNAIKKGSQGSKADFIKIIYWILAFLPLIVTLFILPGAPNTIPAHYGVNNEVNRWGSKYELLIVPVITFFLALIGWVYAKHYNSKEHINKEEKNKTSAGRKAILVGMLCCMAIFNVLTYVFLYTSCNKIENLSSGNAERILVLGLNLFYIAIGNIMPKLKQNSFIGIRVSWTLNNEEVWYRTHRFGGKFWVIGGIILTVVCLLVPDWLAMPISVGGLLVLTVVVCVYARKQYICITNGNNK